MKRLYVMLPLACALTFTACDDYDDTALWEQVNDNTSRIEALEQWQNEVNNNIAALQQLLNTNDMITSVTPVTLGGEVTGYTITFLHSDPITIYHGEKGEDGADGSTPQIGLTRQEDGNWYWTLDGELMLDPNGDPIRANGDKGEQGEDGDKGDTGATGQPGTSAPTPQIKLGSSITSGTIETDNGTKDPAAWYLSVDNGKTWYRISGDKGDPGATGGQGQQGEQGDSFFTKAPEVDKAAGTVTFYLKGGESFTLPLYQGISISFTDIADLNQPIGIDGTKEIPYTVNGITNAKVTAFPSADGWSATVSGMSITVTASDGNAECDLLVTATDNAGNSVSYTLRLVYGYTINGSTYTVSTANGLLAWNEAAQNDPSLNCTLTADIDLTDKEWTPIGSGFSSNDGYQGTFDGQGHSITGLAITTNSTGGENAALFDGVGGNGTVKNLQLKDVNYNVQQNGATGGIARSNYGTITACSVTGDISATGGYVGGIASANLGSIIGCWFDGNLTSGLGNGGIAALNYSTITACFYGGNAGHGATNQGGTVDATKVNDGESWQTAVVGMNKALTDNAYQWISGTDGLPMLVAEAPQ